MRARIALSIFVVILVAPLVAADEGDRGEKRHDDDSKDGRGDDERRGEVKRTKKDGAPIAPPALPNASPTLEPATPSLPRIEAPAASPGDAEPESMDAPVPADSQPASHSMDATPRSAATVVNGLDEPSNAAAIPGPLREAANAAATVGGLAGFLGPGLVVGLLLGVTGGVAATRLRLHRPFSTTPIATKLTPPEPTWLETLLRRIDVNPFDGEARFHLGLELLRRGNDALGLRHLAQGFRYHPAGILRLLQDPDLAPIRDHVEVRRLLKRFHRDQSRRVWTGYA